MDSSLLELMLRMTLACSAAVLLVLAVRRPLRRFAGAGTAYVGWALVPALTLAALLPAARVAREYVVTPMAALQFDRLATPTAPAGEQGWAMFLVWCWLAGALATALMFVVAHRRYLRSLGQLAPSGGVYLAETSDQGPALIGLWRPRVVLPSDFSQRYAEDEQALVVAHERRHAKRRDPLANAFAALLQCCFWFNPLVHVAAGRFRFDQELACDADVIAQYPGTARTYAAAMLKTQVGSPSAALTCHWQSSHPLKERIMQLQKSSHYPARRLAGKVLVASLLCAGVLGTVAVRAAPAAPAKYMVGLKITFAGEYSTPNVLVAANEPFSVGGNSEGKTWKGDFLVTEGDDGLLWLKSQFTIDGRTGGVHDGGMKPGGSKHVTVMSEKRTMLLVLDGSVTPVDKAPAN